MNSTEDAAAAVQALRAVLDGVEHAPDVVLDSAHLAYLRGATDALALLAQGERPDANEPGRLQRDAVTAE